MNAILYITQILEILITFCSSLSLENPMDRGAWQATLNGVTKSQTEAIYKIGNQQRPTVERRGLYSISCNNL